MKKSIVLLFALCLSFTLAAQPPRGGGFPGGGFPGGFPGGMRMGMPGMSDMDADQTAKMRTDLLDQVVDLDEKQYKKIYNLHKGLVEDLELQGMSTAMPMMPMMRGRGGFPGGMMGGMPGNFQNDGQEEEMSEYEKAVEARNQKIRDNQDKKMIKTYKKVLTPEQYAKWEANEKEKEERARQLLERFRNGEMPETPEPPTE